MQVDGSCLTISIHTYITVLHRLDRQLAKPQLVPTVMTPTSLRAAMAGGFGFGKKAKSKGKLDDGEKEIRRSGSSKGLKQRLGR